MLESEFPYTIPCNYYCHGDTFDQEVILSFGADGGIDLEVSREDGTCGDVRITSTEARLLAEVLLNAAALLDYKESLDNDHD